MRCVVCGKRASKTSNRIVHRFPINEAKKDAWLEALDKPLSFKIFRYDGVCGDHFRDDCYEIAPDATSGTRTRPRYLLFNALPTLNLELAREYPEKKAKLDKTKCHQVSSTSGVSSGSSTLDENPVVNTVSSTSTVVLDAEENTSSECLHLSSEISVDEGSHLAGKVPHSPSTCKEPHSPSTCKEPHSPSTCKEPHSPSNCEEPHSHSPSTCKEPSSPLSSKQPPDKTARHNAESQTRKRKRPPVNVPKVSAQDIGHRESSSSPISSLEHYNPKEDKIGSQDVPELTMPSSNSTAQPVYHEDTLQQPVSPEENLGSSKSPLLEAKYLTFESSLMLLFNICHICHNSVTNVERNVCGSAITIETLCTKGHIYSWSSQPKVGKSFWGNLLVAATMLFSGSLPHKFMNVFRHLNIAIFSENIYNQYEKSFFPIIHKIWKNEQRSMFKVLKGQDVMVSYYQRADHLSKGKYGTCILMEANKKKMIHMEIVKATDSSLETEGFNKAVNYVEHAGLLVQSVVVSGQEIMLKFLQETFPKVETFFDCSDVVQGVEKDLYELGKQVSCSVVLSWVSEISKHLYWCSTSSTPGTNIDKWKSIRNHIANVHHGHGGSFPSCIHKPIPNTEKIVWMKKDSIAYKKICSIILAPPLLMTVDKLSDPGHSAKGFHEIALNFAPKNVYFPFNVLRTRLTLAMLHYNENGPYETILKDFRKETTPKNNVERITYNYVKKLLLEMVECFGTNSAFVDDIATCNDENV